MHGQMGNRPTSTTLLSPASNLFIVFDHIFQFSAEHCKHIEDFYLQNVCIVSEYAGVIV